jgi:hypothetical protein
MILEWAMDDLAGEPVMKKNPKRNAPKLPQMCADNSVVECMMVRGRACMGTHQWRGHREQVVIAVAEYLKTTERSSICSIREDKNRQITIVTEHNFYVGD